MNARKVSTRLLSFLLAFCMVFGMLPVTALNADASNNGTEYLFLATDRHGDTDIIGKLLTKMESVVGDNVIDYVGLAGDMVDNTDPYDSSTVLNEVTAVASNMNASTVDLTMANHDSGCTDDAGIMNYASGQWYSGTNYYVYGVIEDDVKTPSSAETAAEAFQKWAESLTDNKVIVVTSHYPLHAKRGDNNGAGYWHKALNAVATDDEGNIVKDVLFFHGHNHTEDTTEYYYGVNETMAIENLDSDDTSKNINGTSACIYYTYATAGYLTETRGNGQATLLAIGDKTITVNKYKSDSYSVLGAVTRVVTESHEHSYGEGVVTTAATCTEAGVKTFTCSACGDSYTEAIAATGHSYENGACTVCGEADPDYVAPTTSEPETTEDTTESSESTGSTEGTEEPTEKEVSYILAEGTTTYTVGDKLTFSVYVGYTDESYEYVTQDDCEITMSCSAHTTCADVTAAMSTVACEQGDYHQVTVTYGGKSTTYDFTVGAAESLSGDVDGVVVFVSSGVVGTITTAVSSNANVGTAMADVGVDNYIAYDIIPLVAMKDGNSATVSLPVDASWDTENLAVYYVSDDGTEVKEYECTYADGYVTFQTTHFSTWVVAGDTTPSGGTTDSETPGTDSDGVDYETAEDGSYQKVTLGSDETKPVYVLVSTPTAGNDYVIASIGSAGSAYALKQNTTTGSSVTVNAATGSITAPWIENPDDAIVWTASSGLNFNSGSYWLNYSQSKGSYSLSFGTNENNASDWTADTNALYRNGQQNDYYLRCNDGTWTMGSSGSTYNVYFYEKQTLTVDSSVTYEVVASDIEHIYDSDDTTAETATITYALQANGETKNFDGEVWTFAIVSDPNQIIASTSDDTITFSGKEGTAQVRVYYTVGEYKVWTTINVTASAPYYTIQLHLNENGTLGEEITAPVALKGVKAGDTYSVWAVVKEHTSTNPDGKDMGELGNALTWLVSDPSIATIDATTGVITFTGENYGTFTVTVTYTGADGKLITDMITISATESLYVVPGDGTNDFPEYPNEGAIRFDKTATAVGNFSQTGIAKVELSMTGVPYSTGSEIDVVIMLDMTGSMSDTAMTAAEESAIAFAEQIVKNEDGSFNNNRICVMAFNSSGSSPFTYWSLGTITADQWDSFCTAVRGASDDQTSGGTPYDEALEKCQSVLQSAKTDGIGNDRQQFCVFVSDGGPTSYQYITNYDAVKAGTATSYTTASASATGGSNQADSNFATIATYTHEYYSTLMKDDGVTMFSVLTGLSASSYPNCATILRNIASSSDNAYVVEDGSDTTALTGALADIAQKIVEAAKNVVVEDKVGEDYTLNFKLPTNVTTTEAGMSEFYIQVLDYQLDANKERTGTPTVLENFTFDANGALKTHSVNGTVTCEGTACTHVTFTTGKVTKIEGTYFTYTCAPKLDANGNEVKNEVGDTITEEYLTWNAEKLSTTELVLEYFAYLDNSAGYDANQQVDAGTYYTNEYATITYDNYQGNRVQQEFPVPQMTWNGAQVTYVFYLVNDAGQPVNRAGRVIPFAEALYVTDPVTYNVTWNDLEGSENMLAEDLLASANVPDVFALYDENAYYEIRVYQTEGVDSATQARNYNYFIIEGGTDVTNKETTKVFNTKAGTKYDDYGAYSATAGSYLSHNSNTSYTATVTDDIDYANTTVAFAVVWKPELVEDTVVVDYGLDVVIDVTTNDAMASGVVGVRTDAPKSGDAEVNINSGTYTRDKENTNTSVDVSIGNMKIGTAKVENNTSVRFSFDKTNGMQFTEPAVFYYESDVNYYDNGELKNPSMYSKVTVIPATTVYYEDSFLTLESYTKGDDGSFTKDTTTKWTQEGTTLNKTQDTDRPGEGKISELYDAENKYGYDSAYETMSQYSMGSAAMVHVDENSYATAEFTFYGTGFDVIGLTSNDTGTLAISVKAAEIMTIGDKTYQIGDVVKNLLVDTYYGYTYNETTKEWKVTDTDAENPLYQVPVMKVAGLNYGKYSVTITATYASFFDHTTEDGYDLYLDAIRIYDPVDPDNTTVEDIYKEDGEGWPIYKELRNMIIEANSFDVYTTEENATYVDKVTVEGVVFIDGYKKCASIADYTNYGPNNELYLDQGQAIAFEINDVFEDSNGTQIDPVDVQIALKTVNGTATATIFNPSSTTTTTDNGDGTTTTVYTATKDNLLTVDVNTATDMYYSIKEQANDVIVISNTGSGILSITNLKFTFEEEATVREVMMLMISEEDATAAVQALSFYTNTTVTNTTIEEDDQVEEPKPEVKETEPKVEEPKPEVKETEPKVEEPKPEVKETEPKVEEPKPEVNETEPKVEEPKPEVNETEPKVEEPKPEVKETEPKVEEPKPEVNETEPKVEEPKPEVNETEPKVEDAPVEEAPVENNILNNIRNAINSLFEVLFGWLVD